MMPIDNETAIKIVGATLASKDLLTKILGPTSEYLGGGIKSWTQKRVENVERILGNAKEKLGDRIDERGSVHPKVLKEMLDEGSYTDDHLTAEYFGGVLASSRTGVSRDDRGAAMAQLVGRMSSYQIRAHFYFYTVFKQLYDGDDADIGAGDGAKLATFFPLTCFEAAMDFTDEEDANSILGNIYFGFQREDLTGWFMAGQPEELRVYFADADEPGMLVSPSGLGAELYLWALGSPQPRIKSFLSVPLDKEMTEIISILPGPKRAIKPRSERNSRDHTIGARRGADGSGADGAGTVIAPGSDAGDAARKPQIALPK